MFDLVVADVNLRRAEPGAGEDLARIDRQIPGMGSKSELPNLSEQNISSLKCLGYNFAK